MRLEEQLAKLADLGLKLDDGITVDDLLYSFGREDYEKRPFDLILFVLGIEVEREPWGVQSVRVCGTSIRSASARQVTTWASSNACAA